MADRFCILWFVLVLLLAYLPGCSTADVDAARFDGWAAAVAGASKMPTSKPTPTPTPDGKCISCGGTGQVGDGVIFSVCLDCNGTGVTDEPKPSTPPTTCTANSCQGSSRKTIFKRRLFWRLRRR